MWKAWYVQSWSYNLQEGIQINIHDECYRIGPDIRTYVESHSALTQLMGSLTPRRLSVRKMNQAKTAYIANSGTFKGIGFRKINHQCSNGANINKKMLKVLCNLKQKLNSALTESMKSDEWFEYLDKFDSIF